MVLATVGYPGPGSFHGGYMGKFPKRPAGRLCPEMRTLYLSVELLIKAKTPDGLVEEAIREHLLLLACKGEQDLKALSQWN